MKSLILFVAAAGALALAGCDQPTEPQVETAPPPIEAPVEAAPVEPVAPPPAATTPRPTDNSTLPADQRSSEQSVQPESETLFY